MKRKVFKHVLKAATDAEFLISLGSLFHNVGAATAKVLSPYNFVLVSHINTPAGFRTNARGKFEELERNVRVAQGAAKNNRL